jgi:hypothetical protein
MLHGMKSGYHNFITYCRIKLSDLVKGALNAFYFGKIPSAYAQSPTCHFLILPFALKLRPHARTHAHTHTHTQKKYIEGTFLWP